MKGKAQTKYIKWPPSRADSRIDCAGASDAWQTLVARTFLWQIGRYYTSTSVSILFNGRTIWLNRIRRGERGRESLVTLLILLLLLLFHRLFASVALFLVFFINWNCRVVVQTLSHQLESQRVLLSGRFLDFGSFVLEPDFDLIFMQLKFVGQFLTALLV